MALNVPPEQMPHLEPLGEPNIEAHTMSPSLPPSCKKSGIEPLKLSLVLENRGSVARDHLASERTYLAYARTSLACASAGVALVQLFTLSATASVHNSQVDLSKFAKPLGAAVILFALIILAMGFVRYFSTQSALIRGYFPVARYSIMATASALGALVIAVFAVIIAGTRS